MIHLRKATVNDLAILKHWDEQAHVIAADPNDDWNWEQELHRTPEWRAQWIAELHGQPLGFIQIIDPHLEASHYWGEVEPNKRAIDIWIGEEEHLGKGYGTTMMSLALEICFSKEQVTEVLIDPLESNTRAINFYKKIGFQFVEKRKFGEDWCEVYSMTRAGYHSWK